MKCYVLHIMPWVIRVLCLISAFFMVFLTLSPASVTAADVASPTVTPSAAVLSSVVLVGTDKGLNLIDSNGVSVLNKDLSWVKDVLIDRKGHVWAISSSGLEMYDGQNWEHNQQPEKAFSLEALALDPSGRLWIGYYGGVSMLSEGKWTNYSYEAFGLGKYGNTVKDLAFDNQKRLWVATASGVAVFDGNLWSHYDASSGLTTDAAEKIIADADGKVWVANSYGVDVFNGTNWTSYGDKTDSSTQIRVSELLLTRALAVDNQGYIWAGTYDEGVSYFNKTAWINYNNRDNFQGGSVNSISFDKAGRTWLGTDFGLVVFDGKAWSHYTLNSSKLLSNNVLVVLATNTGLSSVPQPSELANGSVTGRVFLNGQTLGGAQVIISRDISWIYSGNSPVQGVSYSGNTDEKGVFLINNIPPNRYDLAVKTADSKWYKLFNSVQIIDGGLRDLGEMTLR